MRPLKSVRGNKVYAIRNHTLESITCDDNGTCACSNQNKRTFYAEISNYSAAAVRTCHMEDGIFHYKEKTGQGYIKFPVEEEDVLELEKYYRCGIRPLLNWKERFTESKMF